MNPISSLEPEAGGGDPPEKRRRRPAAIVPVVATSAFAALAMLGATIGIDGRLDPLGGGDTAELRLAMTPRGMGGGHALAARHVGPRDIRGGGDVAAGPASGRAAAAATPSVRLGPVIRLATHVPPAAERATERVRIAGASTTGVAFGTATFDGGPREVSQGPDGPGLPPPVDELPGLLRTTIAAVGDLARDGVAAVAPTLEGITNGTVTGSDTRVEVDLVTRLEPSDFGSRAASTSVGIVSDDSQALAVLVSAENGEPLVEITPDGLDPISDLVDDPFGNELASLGGDVGDALDALGDGLETAGLDLGDPLGDLGSPLGELGSGLGELGGGLGGLDGLGDLPSDLGGAVGAVGAVTDTVGDLL